MDCFNGNVFPYNATWLFSENHRTAPAAFREPLARS